MEKTSAPPPCAGTYAPGEQACDGRLGVEPACGFQRQCEKIKAFCKVSGISADSLAESLSMDEMVRLASRLTDLGYLPEGETLETARAGRRRPDGSAHRRFGSEEMWLLYCHFEGMLVDRFPDRKFMNSLLADSVDMVVEPGTLYANDRTRSRKYVTILCKSPDNLDVLLIGVKLKPQMGVVDVWLPVDVALVRSHFSRETWSKLSLQVYRYRQNRQVRTVCSNQSYEGVGLAVGVMRRLTERDTYKLPEARHGL